MIKEELQDITRKFTGLALTTAEALESARKYLINEFMGFFYSSPVLCFKV